MNNWNFNQTPLTASDGVEYAPHEDGQPLTYLDVLRLWRDSAAFREKFSSLIAGAPYAACFWEVRPVTRKSASRPFTFVVVDAPALAGVRANEGPFTSYFNGEQAVVTFDNLGGDATLVVPAPLSEGHDRFAHLADFLRTAPRPLVHGFWQAVAQAVTERLGESPVWLSTSGLGVFWLHARLDSRPKYYTHAPFCSHDF